MMELAQIKACVLIPTYNNERTLSGVIEGVLAFSSSNDIIVINDGSTDSTSQILASFEDKIIVLGIKKNTGKGFAIRRGFKEAISRGFDYAITIDSDGQHFPEDIPQLIQAALDNPGALIMGSRNMTQQGVPGKSSFGNKFSNFWYWVETGITLPDTQTGFRLYPLEPIKTMRLFTLKFETEIEVIVKLAWSNVKVIPVEVKVLYDREQRVSHFRPFRDFTRISILNTYLVTLSLLFYLPKRLLLKVYQKGFLNLLKEQLTDTGESNLIKAMSVGFGVFMGIFPIWGFQLMVGIPLSFLFRLNKVLFLVAANISIPPFIPPIIFFSYYLGGFFVEKRIQFEGFSNLNLQGIHINMLQYLIGAVILSILSGLTAFLISFAWFSKRR